MTKREELKEAIKIILNHLVKDVKQYVNVDIRIDISTNEILKEVEMKFFN
jgi:hypothetical protein